MRISNAYLGRLEGANMNTTSDQIINISGDFTKYIVRKIVVCNASANMTLVAGGIYTGISKTGTTVVSALQSYTSLSGSTKWIDLTLASGVTGDIISTNVLYLSLTTAQGSVAFADFYLFGDMLS